MIQLELDLGGPRHIGDVVRLPADPEPGDFQEELIINEVIPEEIHDLPYGVSIPNPEMYKCEGYPHAFYWDDVELVGRYI